MIEKFGNSLLLARVLACQFLRGKHSKSVSSNIWLERQRKDPFVKRASKELYRARSAFKLIEIDDKFKFMNPGDVVIDIGSAPGSWTQVSVKRTNSNKIDANKLSGLVISVDREDLSPLEGACLLPFSDITKPKTFEDILKILNGRKAKSVISDMAPNSIGQSTFDHDSIISLQRTAFGMAKFFLSTDGYFLCKIWFGDSTKEFMSELERYFKFVKLVKPEASRQDSSEIFIFCSGFNQNK